MKCFLLELPDNGLYTGRPDLALVSLFTNRLSNHSRLANRNIASNVNLPSNKDTLRSYLFLLCFNEIGYLVKIGRHDAAYLKKPPAKTDATIAEQLRQVLAEQTRQLLSSR